MTFIGIIIIIIKVGFSICEEYDEMPSYFNKKKETKKMKLKIQSLMLALSVLVLAFIVLPSTADAASAVTVRQTGQGDNYVTISHDVTSIIGTKRFAVQASTDKVNWSSVETNTAATQTTIRGLASGRTVYVRVRLVSPSTTGWTDYEAVTEPASTTAMIGLRQTAATTDSYTVSWNAIPGANIYKVYEINSSNLIATVAGTSFKRTGVPAGQKRRVYVEPARRASNGYIAASGYSYVGINAVTSPSKPAKNAFGIQDILSSTGKIMFRGITNGASCDGYEIVGHYLKSGKKAFSGSAGGLVGSTGYISVKKGGTYKYKMRYYVYGENNQKFYSAWSPVRYFAFNVVGGKSHYRFGSKTYTSLKPTWNKVQLAKKYIVYVSTSEKTGFKKVKTVSGKKRGCTLTRFKGKKFSRRKTYYIKVVSKVKYKKKYIKLDYHPVIKTLSW